MEILSLEKSQKLAADFINTHITQHEWAFFDDKPMEFALGWLFFYNSREYVETRSFLSMLIGTPPVLVNKYTHKAEFVSVEGFDYEGFLTRYERKNSL